MLAYVFWHWRYPYVDKAAYQQHLIDFHVALRAQKPAGFHYSTVFQVEHAPPWIDTGGEAYEEWYVVANFAALEALNEGAVSGSCREPHDRVASQAAGGAGGLYRLRAGEPALAARVALWFAKPSGMSYEDLYAALQPGIEQATGSLWQRQMVLGPAPEFRWHSPRDYALPEIVKCLEIPVLQVWVGM